MAKAKQDPAEMVVVKLIEPHTLHAGVRLPVGKNVKVSAALRDELKAAGKLAE